MDTINKGNRISYRASATSLLALFMFGLGLSAKAQDRKATIITFDAPGAGTAAGQGTAGTFGPFSIGFDAISPSGAVAGAYADASSVIHGFLRTPDGTITTFDAPGAGTGSGQGTAPQSIIAGDAITGFYLDAGNVFHAFIRAPDGTFTTFDIPGAGTGSGSGQGTFATLINPAGTIAGFYTDASNVNHGFVRAPDGTFTTFDAPGAGTGPGQGTLTTSINPGGTITGNYIDANNVQHGFLRTHYGTFTTVDAPGAGTGGGQGTFSSSINPEGVITGFYFGASNDPLCQTFACVIHGFIRAPDGTFTTVDAPGAGTGGGQGTFSGSINPGGATACTYIDANNVQHGCLRTHDGTFTTFDAPGAGTGAGQGTIPFSNNPAGAITGYFGDKNNVLHGFLRVP